MFRERFQILKNHSDNPFIYFDNAATFLRLDSALSAPVHYYENFNANPLRGLYENSVKSTEILDAARAEIAHFIGAEKSEIIFTRNTTESLNLLAASVQKLISTQKILIDLNSHHSNLLPFTERYPDQVIIKENFLGNYPIADDVGLVVLTGMSNISGEIFTAKITELKQNFNGLISVDAAQLIAHEKIDVHKLGVDFLAFSGHKIGSSMGVGILYVKKSLLDQLTPVNYGGEMVDSVRLVHSGYMKVIPEFSAAPQKFEGGTVNLGGIISLSETVKFWQKHNKTGALFQQVTDLTHLMVTEMKKLPNIEIYFANHGIISFNITGVHPHDTAQILANHGIMVRAGYHCAEPFLRHHKIGPVVRASLAFYNAVEEISYFFQILEIVRTEMGLK